MLSEESFETIRRDGFNLDSKLQECKKKLQISMQRFKENQGILQKEQIKVESVILEIKNVDKEIIKRSENVTASQNNLNVLNSEIDKLIKESICIEHKISLTNFKFESNSIKYQEMTSQMDLKASLVEEAFSNSAVVKELAVAKNRLKELKLKRSQMKEVEEAEEAVMAGDEEKRREFCKNLAQMAHWSPSDIKNIIREEEEKRVALKQMIDLLNKKNTARKRRCLRCLQAEEEEYRGVHAKVEALKTNIELINKQINILNK